MKLPGWIKYESSRTLPDGTVEARFHLRTWHPQFAVWWWREMWNAAGGWLLFHPSMFRIAAIGFAQALVRGAVTRKP